MGDLPGLLLLGVGLVVVFMGLIWDRFHGLRLETKIGAGSGFGCPAPFIINLNMF